MIGQSVDSIIRAALESHLCALVLCSTGPVGDIAALPRGYRRASGSFIADGFVEGDTVCVQGFGGERYAVAAAVADDLLSTDRPIPPMPAGSGVTLSATLPEARKFEGQPFVLPKGKPWVWVRLRPMREDLIAFGTGGMWRHVGMFDIDLQEPVAGGLGTARAERLAAFLREHFRVGMVISGVRIAGYSRQQILECDDELKMPVSVGWSFDRFGRI